MPGFFGSSSEGHPLTRSSGASRSVDRRSVLKWGAAGAFGLGSVAVLPAFGTPSLKQSPSSCRVRDRSSDKRLYVSNWPLYIDQPEKGSKTKTTMQDFEAQTGIRVTYTEDINDNDEFFAKVKNQLGGCQSTGRDLMVLTGWMAARMIDLGWIQPLDAAKVPNLHKNLLDQYRNVDFDPTRKYSAPWQGGLAGIAYNKKVLPKGVHNVTDLLTRSDLNGRISVLIEMPDTMGLVLLSDGADPSKFTDAEWQRAIEKLRKSRESGQIRAFTGNDYINDLSAGNLKASIAWSGDIAASGDKNLVFVTPEEGAMIWSDNMLVPNMAQHEMNAEEWINYYYEPEVAARLAAYNNYICPVKGAQEAMAKVDKSLVDNQLIFPSEKTLKQTHSFMTLPEYKERDYKGDFNDVQGG